jgi:hypothetical protein
VAKPYRRRKGKGGTFVGNWRVTVDGRDINLGTKDANEARARAKLAAAGKWPPEEAAKRVALATMDPGTSVPSFVPLLGTESDPPPPPPPEMPAGPPIDPPDEVTPPAAPPDDPPTPGPSETFEAAAARAAAEAGGQGEDVTADKATREKQAEDELAGLMAELSGGAGQSEIVDSVADGLAAGILWLERKSIELGWGWTFRKPTGRALVTKPHDPAGIERKCIKVGMKAVLTVHFPELAAKLTPGWAIAIGCTMGAVVTVAKADFVDIETGHVTTAADAMAAAGAPPIPSMPGVPSPPPASA